jgi:hypothetical protein
MKNSKHMFALGGAALLALAGVVHAEAPATDAALKSEMATLKARIGELEGKQSQQWLDARRTEEVKALVREVLSDADTRASLQGDGAVAGHTDGKFFLASADGNFRLNVGGLIQVRYIINHRNDVGDVGTGVRTNADDNETGFSIARTKLIFDGYIGSPKIFYKIQLAADRNDNSIGAEVVTVGWKCTDKFTISAGRFKDAFLGESIVDDNKQLAVERSIVDSVFSNGYVEGIQSVWLPNDCIKLTTAFHDGANSGAIGGGPAFGNDFQNDATNYAATARVDIKVMGDWKQQADFNSWNDGTALFLGAAATYQEGETGDNQTSTQFDDNFGYTFDAMFKSGGFGAYAAFVGSENRNSENSVGTGETWANMGGVFQLSYFIIPDKLEPFARYEWLNIDSDAGSQGVVNVFTFGANYYIKKHDAKFSLDVVWAAESLDGGSTWGGPPSGAGLLPDSPINEDQVTIRAQFQLGF